MPSVSLRVNGQPVSADIDSNTLLVHFLRDGLGLTGTHVGCDTSQCGACTVHVDGEAVKSCTMFAVQAEGCEVVTIEGLAKDGKLHPMQEAFREHHALAVRVLHAGDDHGGGGYHPKQSRVPTKPPSAANSKATSAAAPAITTSSRPSHRWREHGHERASDRPRGEAERRPALHHRKGTLHRRSLQARANACGVRAKSVAHAKIGKIDAGAALAIPGRGRGADRRGHAGRQGAEPDLRLDDPFQGRQRDEDGAHLALAVDKVRHVGDQVAVVIAETPEAAKDGAEAVAVDYEELPAVVSAVRCAERPARRKFTTWPRAIPSMSGRWATRRQ